MPGSVHTRLGLCSRINGLHYTAWVNQGKLNLPVEGLFDLTEGGCDDLPEVGFLGRGGEGGFRDENEFDPAGFEIQDVIFGQFLGKVEGFPEVTV